jgi:enoyl-CoA hydratase/carnithine racemase
MSETEPLLLIERQGPIAIVTLNRADKRNALSEKLWAELKTTFESFEPDVRCVVLAGAGKHFCAGLDLTEHRHREAFESIFMSRFAHATLDAIQFGGRPVVTAMQGAVIGGGLLSIAGRPPRLLCRRWRKRSRRQDHRLRPHGRDDADRPHPRRRGR